MKTWYEWEDGNYTLEEGLWWVFFIDWVVGWSCYSINCMFSWIKMPSFLYYYDKDSKELYTWREWYGDIGQMFHVFVCDPVFHWKYRRIKELYVKENK